MIAAFGLLAAPSLRAQADHGAQYSQSDIAAGYRVYSSQCVQCHGGLGDGISGVDLRRGVFRRAASDEDLGRVITNGVPGAGMPPFKLEAAELTGVVAFIRAGFDQTASVRVGDPARGRALYDGKGDCATCHRVRGRGALTAPDLSGIGLVRTVAALQRSLLNPTTAMVPANRPLRIVTKRGETLDGRRLNEDSYTVQLLDTRGRLRSLAKSDIRTLTYATASPMPSYASRLTPDEIADLVGYLASLREP
ncbi:MAG TPA: c-type cytochrome [Vicinamibacterales bacterium]|nr:c-type cytochrome [Vicinamibacterales bacterium]